MQPAPSRTRSGIVLALCAYTIWGLFPLYWKLLKGVAPVIIFCHRITWSGVFFLALLAIMKRRGLGRALQNSRKQILQLMLSAGLISINWLTYIYGVNSGHVLETSLGYFINPLVNVFLGMVFLKERLRPIQWLSVLLATAGVLQLALQAEHFPLFALALGFSFGSYGLVRKITPVEPLVASTIESLLLTVPALLFLLCLSWGLELPGDALLTSTRAFTTEVKALLVLGGIVTGIPLLLFTAATKRLSLSTMGFILYVTPSLQFLLAVLLFGETFTRLHAQSFGCIWIALALYSSDLAQHHRKSAKKLSTTS